MYKKKHHNKPKRFQDVQTLIQRIQQQSPKSGDYLYDYKLLQAQQELKSLEEPEFHRKYKINFSDLPISSQTIYGLEQRNFKKMTQIQRCVIPHALLGRDIMAASRTGSGKTLAYLIPLVEKLYRQKFIPIDGLGAIVLVPVRQLAMQVFEVLNSFTKSLEISVGLIIGGKDLAYQKQKIGSMNILICTPGRLLQHLQQTYGFQTGMLQMLVIDEADQMMELGFREALNSILNCLPPRQTLLFSATLNKNIHSLANLSLNDPQRIFLHAVKIDANGKEQQGERNISQIYQTPLKLAQYYMEVPTEKKINTLYSFIKEHPKKKILVFLSTCKQVRFVYQSFKTFKFGCPIYELQGRQKQTKRMAIFYTFCQKQYGILFCTNIASRGLDFPQIDWVVQLDIPEDIQTYVHRVGRTARFRSQGKSLLFVNPSETKFVEELKNKKIMIHKISQNPEKLYSITESLQARCSENPQLKYLAQRSVISYLKFVYKAPNKEFFNVNKINIKQYAESLGLLNAPQISFKKKQANGEDQSENDEEGGQKEQKKLSKIEKIRLKSKMRRMEKLQNIGKVEQNEQKDQEEQNFDSFLKLKKRTHVELQQDQPKALPTLSKRQLKKVKFDGHYEGKNKIIFDQEGQRTTQTEIARKGYQLNKQKQINPLQKIQERLQSNKELDIITEKERLKQKRKKRKIKELREKQQGQQAVLGSDQEDYQGQNYGK